jgi:hypothetical protein
VQQELQELLDGQLAVQLLHDDAQPMLQDEPQLKPQGSRQLNERSPRRSDSSKQGRGQQRPMEGGGIGVQQVGAHDVQVGAGAAQELQPPLLSIPNPTGLMTERVVGDSAAASRGSAPSKPSAIHSDFIVPLPENPASATGSLQPSNRA